MTCRTFVSATLIASLLLAAAPITARAAEGQKPAPTLRASFDRAVADAVAAQKALPAPKAVRARASAATGAQSGGGGGSSTMVISLIGIAAGLAGTYYIVKEMNKQTIVITGQ